VQLLTVSLFLAQGNKNTKQTDQMKTKTKIRRKRESRTSETVKKKLSFSMSSNNNKNKVCRLREENFVNEKRAKTESEKRKRVPNSYVAKEK